MPTFAESFLEGHRAGTASRAVREETAQRRKRLALEAERYKLEARRADTELKLHEMTATNNAAVGLDQLNRGRNAPTIPADATREDGGMGPGAPAPRTPLRFQVGDTVHEVPPVYADDLAIQRRAEADVNAERAQTAENVAIPPELRSLAMKLFGQAGAGLTSVDPKILTAATAAYGQDQANVRDTNNAPPQERMVKIDNPDGSYTFAPASAVQGQTFQKPVKVSDGQRRVLGFYTRAKDAEDALGGGLEEGVSKRGLIGQARLNGPDMLKDEEGQVFSQAQRQFIEATLRKDSGAAIAPAEFNKAARTYFVQPGDGPQVIARKRLARKVQLTALRNESGGAYDEMYGGIPAAAAGTKSGPAPKLGGSRIGRFDVQVEQ